MADSLTYQAAGVNIDTGNELVQRIRPIAQRTQRPGVLAGLGGFGGLFELPIDRYQHPVLVSGTDGVGTKLKLAHSLNKHDTIGIDLVAMCVNDIVVCGAEPLFFLDYYATGHLSLDIAENVVAGIGQGCEQAGIALLGGETAEMPGMYEGEDYDLAGFSVGIVEKQAIIDGSQIQAGDVLIGLASSGPHSNGYSLIRKILDVSNADVNQRFQNSTLGEVLLAPTRIYVKSLLALQKQISIHGLVHITGGGFIDNIPRILPEGLSAVIHTQTWPNVPIFDWLQDTGNIARQEMYRTFNCGIGMIVCVAPNNVAESLRILQEMGETAWEIGHIESLKTEQVILE